MRFRALDFLVLAYGIILIVMAIDGFLHHSVISLISGGLCGLIELGFAALRPKNPRVSRIGAAVVALLILLKFAPDYFHKHQTPALILALSSLIVVMCLVGGHFVAMSQKKSATETPTPS